MTLIKKFSITLLLLTSTISVSLADSKSAEELQPQSSCKDIVLTNYVQRETCKMHIPKVFHKIWLVWNPDKPEIPTLYKEFDANLRKYHPDWQVVEWDDHKVVKFIKEKYPEFLPIYLAYDVPVKKHDAARYLILNYYGGVFIQHSINVGKNLDPLFKGSKFVVAEQAGDHSISNGFIGSVAHHPFWKDIIGLLPNTANLKVLRSTGVKLFTASLNSYMQRTQDKLVAILDKKYVYPFDWKEKASEPYYSKCIVNNKDCFKLLPEAYTYTIWKGDWVKKAEKK